MESGNERRKCVFQLFFMVGVRFLQDFWFFDAAFSDSLLRVVFRVLILTHQPRSCFICFLEIRENRVSNASGMFEKNKSCPMSYW